MMERSQTQSLTKTKEARSFYLYMCTHVDTGSVANDTTDERHHRSLELGKQGGFIFH